MPELGFKQIGQSDTVTERMIQIITAETDHPFSFPEGRQTFISKPYPADEHAPGPFCLGTEFSWSGTVDPAGELKIDFSYTETESQL
ncbi:hypothetical protein ABC466_004060 [Salmonella enterica]|nr:hypothetical protein [Salmonella enterica]EHN5711354.1 hypothetical protein [Salmonella enterica subsp. enterica serovar Napoli]EGH3904650.1 hypothetical protein [Salmonella enterica]EJL2387944.1 hypothetical protein [Salmonella enterica]EJS2968532.1 hypothetical protein [Salmonella enterica]